MRYRGVWKQGSWLFSHAGERRRGFLLGSFLAVLLSVVQGRGSARHRGFLLGSFLAILLSTVGCPQNPGTACKEDRDCLTGQRCQAGSCTSSSEGGQEKAQEPPTPEDGSPNESPPTEPPPFPDTTWGEGSLPPPEHFLDGTIPDPPQGVGRKAGDTCDPSLTGAPADRCSSGLLCAAPDLGPTGICQTSCDPKNPTCPTDRACGPVLQPLTLALLGYACGKAANDGEPCTFGIACKAGSVCAAYGSDTKGVCQKSCDKAADCIQAPGSKGFCGGAKDIAEPSKTITACLQPVTQVGEPCDGPKACDQGLRCVGSPPRCLEECSANNTCTPDKVCVPTLDQAGKPLYAVCYPTRQEGEQCSSLTRCPDGYVCALYSQGFGACAKDCTKDASLCSGQESCESLNSTRKICMLKNVQQGEICEGPRRCAPDLSCIITRPGEPRTCHLSCKGDPAKCSPVQICQPLAEGDAPAICATPCDPQRPCSSLATSCISLAGSSACLPDTPSQRPGSAKRSEPCIQNPAAPASFRCEPSLRCTSLPDGSFCLLPCDPRSPNPCPTNESCLYETHLKGSFCGIPQPSPSSCDLRLAKLCERDQRCLLRAFESKGQCTSDPRLGTSALCLDLYAPCQDELRCSGDPLTPFRWRCRTSCSSASSSCEPPDLCLDLGQGKACFPSCQAAQSCSTGLLCQEIQSRSLCL